MVDVVGGVPLPPPAFVCRNKKGGFLYLDFDDVVTITVPCVLLGCGIAANPAILVCAA